ncbi:MAG: hypothetical protein HY466_04370 [Deltaproteobacteria bacterium]|nr:hypothetical protein [Deltaproteobacteria bacterium]
MPKIRICKDKECHNAATTGGFCRLHYLRNWQKIQKEKRKKSAKNLNRYIESILKRHPDRYVEEIKKDIRSHTFSERIEGQFGGEEEPWSLFDAGTSDEELEQLIDKIKVEKNF